MTAQTTVQTVTLPDLGEGLTESDVVAWLVAVGDTVTLNQVVAEVETAKALVDLPSPYAGVVEALLVEPGTTVPVGGALLTIAVEDRSASAVEHGSPPSGAASDSAPSPSGPASDAAPSPSGAASAADAPTDEAPTVGEPAGAEPGAEVPAPERTSVLVGYGPLVEGSARPHRRPRAASWLAAHATTGNGHGVDRAVAVAEHPEAPATHPRPTPPVRKLAHDLGVNLDLVEGTGDDGRITRDDVLHALSSRRPGAPSPERPGAPTSPASRPSSTQRTTAAAAAPRSSASTTAGHAGDVRTPITGVRRQTAAAMVASAFTAPHASVHLTLDVTATTDLLADLRADRALAGHRLTFLTLVAKAVTLALGGHPALHARWDDAAQEIVQPAHVGLGIAAATPRGLLVPVVHDADLLRLPALADALTALTEAARAGTSTPADLAGGTFTITNIGVFGVDGGVPILAPGQSGILAVGQVRRQPWAHDDGVALRDVLTLTMSFDHRVVDGEQAARFLADVGAVLARPGAVLAMV